MIDTPQIHSDLAHATRALNWNRLTDLSALSSAAVGGGFSQPGWVTNVQVPLDYDRTDLPTHADEIRRELGNVGPGITLFTATDIRHHQRGTDQAVTVDATSGITKPTYAASDDPGWSVWNPGTINLVAALPVTLSPAASVNAVITMTEAKSQALRDLDVPGTGTASDAVVVLWPTNAEAHTDFAGPRSPWGAPLARATYAAVIASARSSLAGLRT